MTSGSSNPFQELSEAWASIYPIFHWVIEHPFGALLLAFIGLYLFWGLLRSLIYLTENLWIRLLRAPVWILQQFLGWLRQRLSLPQSKTSAADSLNRDRLTDLIAQLEDSHQQQADLIQRAKEELKKINASRLG